MKALELILSDKRPHLMDVPHISCGSSSSRFAISCGIGFDAAVCHEVGVTPMKKVLNKIGHRQTGLSLCRIETVAFPEAIFYDTAHG